MKYIKHIAFAVWVILIGTSLTYLFTTNEWEYTTPTPVPHACKAVNKGAVIPVEQRLIGLSGQPVFLHFYNPDCACSRFNVTHVRRLAGQFGKNMEFIVVVPSISKSINTNLIGAQFGGLRVVQDTQLASMCGVYSTPQAVILDKHHKLYYRGNYNRSMYCTDKRTNYAEIALASFVNANPRPDFTSFALVSYGCQLPRCIN